MRRADHIIDLGPGAGMHGGEVVVQGTLRDIESAREFGDRPVPEESAVSSDAKEPAIVRRGRAMDRSSRRAREQSQERRRALSGRPALGHHRHLRLRQIDPDALRFAAGGEGTVEKRARQTARVVLGHHRRRLVRDGLRSGSIADREDVALDAGDLHQGLRRNPQALRRSCRSRACAVIRRAASRSTPKAAAAKRARARE